MLNFLKSFIFPSYMAKHRSMSVLFSLCILVLTCYVFSLPIGTYYLDNKDSFLESQESYMLALTGVDENNADANLAAQIVVDAGLKFDGNVMTIKEDLGKEYSKLSAPFLVYERELKKLNEKGEETEETYIEKCYLTLGIYFDEDTDGDEGEDTKVLFTETEAYKSFNKTPIVENEIQVLLVFTDTTIYYQIGQLAEKDVEYTEEQKALYAKSSALTIPYKTSILFTDLSFDTEALGTTGKSVCGQVAQILSYNYAATNNMYYILVDLLPSCILFPLLFVLLFWIFFKKNGQLKKFREYFNIYAMSSIVPMILCFIVGFFWIYAVRYFLYVAAIFYLFHLYKINSNPNLE